MYFGADHAQSLGAGVDVVQSWFDCAHVPTELLVDPVVGLRDDLVGVVDEAAAEARGPGTHEPAALPPVVQTLAVEGDLGVVVFVGLRQVDVFGFAGQSFVFDIIHLQIYLKHYAQSLHNLQPITHPTHPFIIE